MKSRHAAPVSSGLTRSPPEPLSEDDFEEEARQDAATYAAYRHSRLEKEHMRKENEKRRGEGLPPLKAKAPKRRTEDVTKTGMRAESDDDDVHLQYEGPILRAVTERILSYNPLYQLAGIPDPDEKVRAQEKARSTLVAQLAKGGSASPGPVDVKAVASSSSPVTGASEAEANEEAPEGSYGSEDEEVVVPWGPAVIPQSVEEEEVEGSYSDDERIEVPKVSRDIHTRDIQSLSLASQEELPTMRPYFALIDAPSAIVPYPLDQSGSNVIPGPLNRYLKEYQRQGTRFLYDHYRIGEGAILGDDMGLGKTVQVIAFLSAIMRKTGTRRDFRRRKDELRRAGGAISPQHWPTALIVCPTSLIRNWDRELDRWGYFEHATWRSDNAGTVRKAFSKGYYDIILASYDATRIGIESMKDMPFSLVIADEAHRLKQPTTGISLAMKKFARPVCFALTGTLIQNRMEEMWSILDFVQRGKAGTIKQWRDFAVNPVKKGHQYNSSARDLVLGIMRLGALHEKILPSFYLRRDKRLIAHELPEKRDLVVFCPLAERQVVAYQRYLASEDVQFILRRKEPCGCGSGKVRNVCCYTSNSKGERLKEVMLKSISGCIKVANHLGLLYPNSFDSEPTREINAALFEVCMGRKLDMQADNSVLAALDPRNCGKWTILEGLLRGWRGDSGRQNKVLIFSNSVRLLKMLGEFIATALAFPFEVFTGEVGAEERMAMVDRFQDPELDHFCLLISTKAGGVGLNLTAANKVVIFDPDWNPANDLQAMDRAFRIGQQRTVEVYRLIGQGTIEELVYQRQVAKQQRARQLNQGTFERRIHQGMEGARNAEDQGDLYGAHNLFRFSPKGFFPDSLKRIREAEDQFAQDLIDAEYDEEQELLLDEAEASSDGDDPRKATLKERRNRERRRREGQTRRREEAERLISDESGDDDRPTGKVEKGEDLLPLLGVTAQLHEAVFRDSPEEKKIYELGVKLLRENPRLAKEIKANDIGKHARQAGGKVKEVPRKRLKTDPADEPWKARLEAPRKRPKVLAELSD